MMIQNPAKKYCEIFATIVPKQTPTSFTLGKTYTQHLGAPAHAVSAFLCPNQCTSGDFLTCSDKYSNPKTDKLLSLLLTLNLPTEPWR
mmetsp:Transcript_33863/g.66624  ORF Transcript_33863/g.66624 Transcript_33863/m.66624 type:complete len:88 (-) Transcript_33863:3046-3309(-)